MTADSKDAAVNPSQCWSCGGKVDSIDAFCRHCGMKLPHVPPSMDESVDQHPAKRIHVKLEAIEKLLLKTVIGVAVLLLLVGWLVLQAQHFGR